MIFLYILIILMNSKSKYVQSVQNHVRLMHVLSRLLSLPGSHINSPLNCLIFRLQIPEVIVNDFLNRKVGILDSFTKDTSFLSLGYTFYSKVTRPKFM